MRTGRIQSKYLVVACAAAIAAVGLSQNVRAGVVLNDTFGSSSIYTGEPYPTPTSSSTAYAIASTKTGVSSIAAGDLQVKLGGNTTSGVWEAQALFSSTPITLSSAGDYIEQTITFTATNVAAGDGNSYLYLGLFNSHGNAPASGLASAGLNGTSGSSYATGNAQLWEGYDGRLAGNSGTNENYYRPQQTGSGTTSANQDLFGNGAGGGLYNNPTSSGTIGTSTSNLSLINGNVYTADLLLTLNGDGTLQVTSSLYSGSAVDPANLLGSSSGADATGAGTGPTLSFDALGFGLRNHGTSLNPQMDASSLTISSNTVSAVPEPASLGLLAVGGAALLARRKRRA